MPLVWELTQEIKDFLSPTTLREFNAIWLSQGIGYPDGLIDDLIVVLGIADMHYESILGYLETQQRRTPSLRAEYNGLHAWLVGVVSHFLNLRHALNVQYIDSSLHYFEGMAQLATLEMPLWIFSLNHDLIIECLAAKFGIPLSSGFSSGEIALPRRDRLGTKTGDLKAESITGEQLERGMAFFTHGTPGINLLKIHGALDLFIFNDGVDILKILPLEPTVSGVIAALRAANEELIYVNQGVAETVTTNEITYADDDGRMQFLRRSILTGAYKFDKRHDQVLPRSMLTHFKTHINYVSNLICVGYAFGDIHVNEVIRNWLELNSQRRLEIVDPVIEKVPSPLLHLSPQVDLTKSCASDYFDKRAGIVRDQFDLAGKRCRSWIRQQPDKQEAARQFEAFLKQDQQRI